MDPIGVCPHWPIFYDTSAHRSLSLLEILTSESVPDAQAAGFQ